MLTLTAEIWTAIPTLAHPSPVGPFQPGGQVCDAIYSSELPLVEPNPHPYPSLFLALSPLSREHPNLYSPSFGLCFQDPA
jgi:hypothetical protein